MIVQHCSFVSLATADLERARWFWVDRLGFSVNDEEPGRFFVVNAGGVPLRVDKVDGDVHRVGSTDPVVAFKVASVAETLADLATREVYAYRGPSSDPDGSYAELRDPEGRALILTEAG